MCGKPHATDKMGESGLQPIIGIKVTEPSKQLILKKRHEIVKNLACETA